MWRLPIVALVLAGILVPAGAAQAQTAGTAGAGGIGIRLVAAPASVTGDTAARSYIISRLAPGQTVRRQVEVINSTESFEDVAVYPAGASLALGEFTFAPGHTQDPLSSWTSVSRDVLRLPPRSDAVETVTINVAKDASAGEAFAVIWAQVSAASGGDGVKLVNRVGIRMYISIGRGGTAPPDFTLGALVAARSPGGAPLVAATIHNTGPGLLDLTGSLTLSNGPGGTRRGPSAVTSASPIPPGVSEQATAVLAIGLPRGPWTAVMTLTSGGIVRTARATLTFPGAAVAAPARSHTLILVASGALLLVLAGIGFERLLRRRRAPPRGKGDNLPANSSKPLHPSPIGLR